MELYSYISYCVSEHRCLVLVHLVSVCMIMRMLTLTVIICTEQIFWVCTVWYVQATEFIESSPRNGIHCLRFLLFVLSASIQRFGSRSVKATTLTCTSVAETKADPSQYSTLYNIKYCFIRVKSNFLFGYPVGPFP